MMKLETPWEAGLIKTLACLDSVILDSFKPSKSHSGSSLTISVKVFIIYLFIVLLHSECHPKIFSLLALCLCLQHLHHNFLLFSKESMLDPVSDTLGTQGAPIGPPDALLCLSHLRTLGCTM